MKKIEITIQKKMTKVIRIDELGLFLDKSYCYKIEQGAELDKAIFSKNLGPTVGQNRPKKVKELTKCEEKKIMKRIFKLCF